MATRTQTRRPTRSANAQGRRPPARFGDSFPNSTKVYVDGTAGHPGPDAGDRALRRRAAASGVRHQRAAGVRCAGGIAVAAGGVDSARAVTRWRPERSEGAEAVDAAAVVTPSRPLRLTPASPRPRPDHPTPLRPPRRDHPGDGVHRHSGRHAAPNSSAARSPGDAPSSRPTSTTPSWSR